MSENPWGLTEKEAEIMDMICAHGHFKDVARRLNVAYRSLDKYHERIAQKMPFRHRIMRAIAWDRWRRGVNS